MEWEFDIPTDFKHGGLAIMDDAIVTQEAADIEIGGKSLSFNATLNKGMHIMAVLGAEKCCDKTTRWRFRLNGGAWYDFTVYNLDNHHDNQPQSNDHDGFFRI